MTSLDTLPGARQQGRIAGQVFPKVVDVGQLARALDVLEYRQHFRQGLDSLFRLGLLHEYLLGTVGAARIVGIFAANCANLVDTPAHPCDHCFSKTGKSFLGVKRMRGHHCGSGVPAALSLVALAWVGYSSQAQAQRKFTFAL